MNTIKQRIATPRISTGAELHAELLDSGRSGVRVEMKLPVVRLRGEMLVDFDNCGEVEISTVQQNRSWRVALRRPHHGASERPLARGRDIGGDARRA